MTTFNKTVLGFAAVGLVISFGSVGCGGAPPPPKTTVDADAMDSDGDGVGDKEDKCPTKKEDGQAPNPKDGCPKED